MLAENLRAIFLDAGNTLIHLDRDRIFEAYASVGVDADEDRFVEAEHEARKRLARRAEEGGTGTEEHVWEEYFLTLFRRCGVPSEALPDVGRRVREMHEERHLWTRVEPGTAEALDALRERGYRLGVISNADGTVEDLLEDAGLRPYLDVVVDSHRVGVEKPDPRIFSIALERMGADADESLYAGDLYAVDVVGAREAGLSAVLVDPLERIDYPCESIRAVRELPAYLVGD